MDISQENNYLPKLGALGFTANVKPRKQSSAAVPKFQRFSSRFGSGPTQKGKSKNRTQIFTIYEAW